MDTVNIGSLLSVCIDAAQRAGNEIRKVWKSGNLGIKDKGNDDPFTIADVNSQKLIMGLLMKQFPGLPMVGEEDIEVPPTDLTPDLSLIDPQKTPSNLSNVPIQDVCVFIDPLDATKEFTLGNLEAVITLIGIAVKGKPVAGVMYQPFVDDASGNGTTIYGMAGFGLFGINPVNRNDGRVVLTTTRSHSSPQVDKCIELIKPDEVIKIGGAGYKVLLVLQGKADVYVFPTEGTKKWDSCAPEAVLMCAGGTITDIKGDPLVYTRNEDVHNRHGMLATARNHAAYVEKLRGKL